VKVGQPVKRGDLLGLVGATGRATGAHLHYEVRANGRILNPLQLLLNPRRAGGD
jgi:murein DD-endopeptidase MepM/ murein hydrolase activator NlpD